MRATIDGVLLADAAWSYPQPKRSAIETVGHDFTGYVAFDTTRVVIE